MNKEKLKILISAYACSPYKGSEPGMGWNFVLGLSKYHEVHVITEQLKWKSDIEQFFKEKPELKKNITFYFIQKKRNKKLRKIWPPSYYWYYRQWQKEALQLALDLDQKENFDIVHQLNMVGFREPGYLWQIDKPFVWGPIGGMENTSWKLLLNLDSKNYIYYSFRNLLNLWQQQFLTRPKRAAKRSNSVLIAATPKNQKGILKYWNKQSIIMPEVGQEKSFKISIQQRDENEPLKIIWSGQHTGGKALNILLKSLNQLPKSVKWKLIILGSGSMTEKWKKLANDLGIEKQCEWHNWLEKEEAHKLMKASHLLSISSVKDLTSTVTLEGLSFGLPLVCIDHCGFSHVVNESCGIKIPIDLPPKLITNFGNAIQKLYNNEQLRQELAKGALKRAKTFSWDKKIEKLNDVYTSLLTK